MGKAVVIEKLRLAATVACVAAFLLGITRTRASVSDPENAATFATPVPQSRGKANTSVKVALVVYVIGEDGSSLAQQAFVNLRSESNQAENWTTTHGKAEVTFQGVLPGTYKLEVGAVGYHAASEKLAVGNEPAVNRVTIKLKADPLSAVPAASPVSPIPLKARKETQQAIEAFNSGDLNEAEGHLRAAYKTAPESAELNYALGTLFFMKKDLTQAQTYLSKATVVDPRHTGALTMLGDVHYEQDDYANAVKVLEQAVALDPQDWMAHWLLANSYLKQQQPEKAREQAQLAIDTGKGAANAARLVLGEALGGLGRSQEAITALQSFLREMPNSVAAPEVRNRLAELKVLAANAAAAQPAPARGSARSLADYVLPEPLLSISGWGAPGIDEARPVVAPGVTCPQQRVVEEAGSRMVELVDNISRFDAVEEIIHEDQDELGKPITRTTRKYAYVAMLSPTPLNSPAAAIPVIREDRLSLSGLSDFPGGIGTNGLPTLAFVFHPTMRDTFEIACEGLGEWQGQAVWLMHFRQRGDRPNYLQQYRIGNRNHPIALKGRAWIAASSYQVIHMQAELVSPMPEIKLLTQHYIVDYGLVRFETKDTDLWLPKQAELYFHFRGHRYYRRHSFDSFRLFSVDSSDKVAVPKAEDPPQDPGA